MRVEERPKDSRGSGGRWDERGKVEGKGEAEVGVKGKTERMV